MKTYLMIIGYDGTNYHGWQKQSGVVTIQETVECALEKLLKQTVSVTASGRTDEGVHAAGQAVTFSCDTSVPAANFPAALNAYLPPDVRAISCAQVPDGFCARKRAKKKTYVYRMYYSKMPLVYMDRFALRVAEPLDTGLLNSAAKLIEGTHDFKEFYCLGSSAKTTVRSVYSCSFTEYPPQGIMPAVYEFKICGNGFLYKMVRLLAGALLQLNSGKTTIEDFSAALLGEPDKAKKVPAESKGLTLYSVEYV